MFPPSGFDARVADRSSCPPAAHMWLEHVYGYAGHDTLQSNVFYTKNTTRCDGTHTRGARRLRAAIAAPSGEPGAPPPGPGTSLRGGVAGQPLQHTGE